MDHPRPLAEIGVGLAGLIEWELIDAETGLVKRRAGPYPNVIVDAGMNALGTDGTPGLGDMVDRLAVGTGTSTPAQNQTSLDTEVVRKNFNSQSESSGPNNDYWEATMEYEFGQAEANANLTELGCFETGGTMWMRQRFKDAQGNNTTITKTSDDILRVRYLLRIYPDKTVKTKNVSATIRGSSVSTTVTYQPQRININTAWGLGDQFNDGLLQDLGTWPTGSEFSWTAWEDKTPPGDFVSSGPLDNSNSANGTGGASYGAYAADSFQRDLTIALGPTASNFATGIGALAYSQNDALLPFLLLFDPRLDKTSQDDLSVTVRISWSRAVI